MKAVILAGGKGTRGRPYTDYFPKAMIPVCGRPLIHHIIKYLKKFKFITEVIIIADFDGLGGQIADYFGTQKDLVFVQDTQSGTGGDLVHIQDRLQGDQEFVLWFVDNLCAVDLAAMLDHFKAKQSKACIATRTRRKEETGFALVRDGMITQFQEKPTIDLPLSECLGIYIMSSDVIGAIRSKGGNVNLSYDVLEQLPNTSAFDIGDKKWIDIQSPVSIDRNQDAISEIKRQMGL